MLFLTIMSEKSPPGHPSSSSCGGVGFEDSCTSCNLSSSYDYFDLDDNGRVVVRRRSAGVSRKVKENACVVSPDEVGVDVLVEGNNNETGDVGSSRSSSKNGGNSISKFLTAGCNLICCVQMTPQRLLKSAFSIRAFRGSEIRKVSTKVEMLLKSNKSSSALPKMKRSKSNENLPSSQSQMDIQMMSHTLAIKEGKTTPDHKTHSMGVFLCQDFKSSVASKDSLLVLWQWLPVRITMYQPVLLYTSEEHGCSLTTFFNRVENHEPTLLIIKTTTDEVFGAYCSTMWATRNKKDEHGERQRYFGTGETFLFTLWPERVKYSWIGIKPRVDNSDGEGENEENSPNQKNKNRTRGDELFMHADTHMISIGGGQGQGICLDEDLRFGKSESCLTFNNPPLCESKDFEVRVLEVIGFTGL